MYAGEAQGLGPRASQKTIRIDCSSCGPALVGAYGFQPTRKGLDPPQVHPRL